MNRGIVSLFLLCTILLGSPVYATDTLDLATGLRTMLLLNNKPSGTIPVAVVFDAANPQSKSDADAIKSNIDSGAGVPNGLKLSAQLVSISEISKLAGSKVAFLADAVPATSFDSISSAAAANGVLTISADLNCVKSNKCVLGIVSKPRVEIYYSRAASDASQISFASAFLMLVKQI